MATIEKPSTETTSVGIQKNNTLKMVLPRLAAKNRQNSNAPTIQNLSEKMFSTSRARTAASPVAFDPRRNGQKHKLRNEYRRQCAEDADDVVHNYFPTAGLYA